jgi:hypothetical protein
MGFTLQKRRIDAVLSLLPRIRSASTAIGLAARPSAVMPEKVIIGDIHSSIHHTKVSS